MTSMHSLRFMEQRRKFATSSTTVRSSDNGNHKNGQWLEIIRINSKNRDKTNYNIIIHIYLIYIKLWNFTKVNELYNKLEISKINI